MEFPAGGPCSSLATITGTLQSSISVALRSGDGQCCPVTSVVPTPPVGGGAPPAAPASSCDTCFVWEVLGPDGTASSTTFNFLDRKDCAVTELRPDDPESFDTCCEHVTHYNARALSAYLADGSVVSGFRLPLCTRTTARLCGTFASEAAGRAVLRALWNRDGLEGSLRTDFDNTDDTCPMALANNTVRFYTSGPLSRGLDRRCVPISYSLPNVCGPPSRDWVYGFLDYYRPFPTDRCQSEPGTTPFRVDPYMEILWGNASNMYCVRVLYAAPAAAQAPSACGNTTSVARAAFWLLDMYSADVLGVHQMALSGRYYSSQRLEATWGPEGDNTLSVRLSGWDTNFVRTKRPKLCLEMPHDTPIWFDTVDGMGFLWTALYDASGGCCPTFYANRY